MPKSENVISFGKMSRRRFGYMFGLGALSTTGAFIFGNIPEVTEGIENNALQQQVDFAVKSNVTNPEYYKGVAQTLVRNFLKDSIPLTSNLYSASLNLYHTNGTNKSCIVERGHPIAFRDQSLAPITFVDFLEDHEQVSKFETYLIYETIPKPNKDTALRTKTMIISLNGPSFAIPPNLWTFDLTDVIWYYPDASPKYTYPGAGYRKGMARQIRMVRPTLQDKPQLTIDWAYTFIPTGWYQRRSFWQKIPVETFREEVRPFTRGAPEEIY